MIDRTQHAQAVPLGLRVLVRIRRGTRTCRGYRTDRCLHRAAA